MSFKITITNNETGEELVSHDNVKAIIGGISLPDEARGANAAEEAVQAIKARHPKLHLLMPAIHALSSREVEDRSTEVKNDAD